jgi:hypothetical protein
MKSFSITAGNEKPLEQTIDGCNIEDIAEQRKFSSSPGLHENLWNQKFFLFSLSQFFSSRQAANMTKFFILK